LAWWPRRGSNSRPT